MYSPNSWRCVMEQDKCSVCGDDLLPDEASVCWQCEMEMPALDFQPDANVWDRLLILFVALMAYLMLSHIGP